jgi:hypothetical protein
MEAGGSAKLTLLRVVFEDAPVFFMLSSAVVVRRRRCRGAMGAGFEEWWRRRSGARVGLRSHGVAVLVQGGVGGVAASPSLDLTGEDEQSGRGAGVV